MENRFKSLISHLFKKDIPLKNEIKKPEVHHPSKPERKRINPLNKILRIEDIRNALSNIATWLTFDGNTRFLKDERNQITSEHGKGLDKRLAVYTIRCRKLFNEFSESLEDIDVCRKSLRSAIERDKEMKRNRELRK